MRTLFRALVVSAVVAAPPLASLSAQAADQFAGTWELNVAKSKFTPGPAPKSETRTYSVAGTDVKAASKTVDASGKTINQTWSINEDGVDRPTTGDPDADALAVKRIDSHTVAFTQKRAGKVVGSGTRVISRDGKTLTISTKRTNVKGEAITSLEIFEKK